jgi:hypothetical protein
MYAEETPIKRTDYGYSATMAIPNLDELITKSIEIFESRYSSQPKVILLSKKLIHVLKVSNRFVVFREEDADTFKFCDIDLKESKAVDDYEVYLF